MLLLLVLLQYIYNECARFYMFLRCDGLTQDTDNQRISVVRYMHFQESKIVYIFKRSRSAVKIQNLREMVIFHFKRTCVFHTVLRENLEDFFSSCTKQFYTNKVKI